MTDNPIIKGQLVCVALNDREQFDAMQTDFNQAPYKKPPAQPVLYFKPHNTWNVDNAVVAWADKAEAMVVGASLAVVIEKSCCRVSEEAALQYVSGYTLVHDFSLPEASYYRPDIKGKCLDGSAPVGSRVVPLSAVADPQALRVVTKINGQVVNELPLSRTVRSVAEIISTLSYIMTLQAGDVIAVAFPGQRALVNKGDEVVSEIAGLVTLKNTLSQ